MKKQTNKLLTGFALLVAGYLFTVLETAYFGWNMTPQSNAEATCDHVGGLMVLAGCFVLMFVNYAETNK